MTRTKIGRKGGSELARNALAINSFLARARNDGMLLTRKQVAMLLDLRQDEQERTGGSPLNRAIDLVTAGFEGEESQVEYLIADLEDENTRTIAKSSYKSPIDKPIRLSWTEAAAIEAAILQTGGLETQLTKAVKDAWWPQTIDHQTFENITDGAETVDKNTIRQCNWAILKRLDLKFVYCSEKGEKTVRRVTPHSITHDRTWTLKAIDLDKMSYRNFRLDRISNVKRGKPSDMSVFDTVKEDEPPTIRLMFKDLSWLDLFLWPELALDDMPQEGYAASGTIPFFKGSKFIPAQIAATAGDVICDNDEVMQAARNWLEGLKGELP